MKKNFEIIVTDGVYPPSEDSYLLLDIMQFGTDDIVLDVGCGAGLGTLLASSKAQSVIAVDISLDAVKNTISNLKKNNLGRNVQVFQSDLLSALAENSMFSIILFNPPYLPEDDKQTSIDHVFIGGKKGVEITQQLINQAAQHLIAGGRLFLVVSTLADSSVVFRTLDESGFDTKIVAEKNIFFERISVLEATFRGHKETVL